MGRFAERQLHPSWYWRRYDDIFGRGEGYRNDAKELCKLIGSPIAFAQEIGAGKGDHAQALLERCVGKIEVVDIDCEAIDLLNCRFGEERRVCVVQGDGFGLEAKGGFDLVYCMYSVALRDCVTIDGFISRVLRVLSRLRPGGAFVFEVIDYEASRRVYPDGQASLIYSDGLDWMKVSTDYSGHSLSIRYHGFLDGDVCEYTANLLRIERNSLREIIEKSCGCIVEVAKLDSWGRRLLFSIRHGRY